MANFFEDLDYHRICIFFNLLEDFIAVDYLIDPAPLFEHILLGIGVKMSKRKTWLRKRLNYTSTEHSHVGQHDQRYSGTHC